MEIFKLIMSFNGALLLQAMRYNEAQYEGIEREKRRRPRGEKTRKAIDG
jgi:hypothetical protein